MPSVTIYSKPNCVYCNRAKDHLNQKGISYNEVVIGEDISRDDFIIRFRGVRQVPHIIVDGVAIGGFEQLVEWTKNNDQARFLIEG
jgi:glutaredoxin